MNSTAFGVALVVIAFLGFFGLLPAFAARRKGRSFFAWWVFGTLCFVVAAPCVLFVRSKKDIPTPTILDAKVSWSGLLFSVGVLLALGVAASEWKSPRDLFYENMYHSIDIQMCEQQGRCGALEQAREDEWASAAKRRWLYLASGFLCIVGIGMYANDRFKRKRTQESHIPIE